MQAYELKRENKLTDATEISTNPFDKGEYITGPGNIVTRRG